MIRNDLSNALKSGKPVLISPTAAASFLKNAELAMSNPSIAYAVAHKEKFNPKKARRGVQTPRADDDFDEMLEGLIKPPSPAYVTPEGIGVIPICGVIGKRLSWMEKSLGCADLDDIVSKLNEWRDDPFVQEIFLDINSGGGTTTGLEETAKVIREYPKFTTAFSEEDCGSAAYWLASQCKRVLATPSSSWGAVGIYVVIEDESQKYAKEGKTVIVIRNGDYKGMGIEGTSLSEKQMDWMQYEVDELRRRFVRDVKSVRMFVSDEDLQGQSFYGDIAAQKGIVTGVVWSREEALDSIKALRQTVTSALAKAVVSPIG